MKEQLAKIRAEALSAFESVADPAALDELRVKYLGKKGELTAVLKQMGRLSAEERPAMGALANEVRAALENALENASQKLAGAALEMKLKAETVDVTIPGKHHFADPFCISMNQELSSLQQGTRYCSDVLLHRRANGHTPCRILQNQVP